MAELEEEEFNGVMWRVLKVDRLDEGLVAIQCGEEAVEFSYLAEIGQEGAKKVGLVLENNRTLKLLKLGFNKVGDEGAGSLSEAIKVNKTLTTLSLQYSHIGPEGARLLSRMLKMNKTLCTLDLLNNKIGPQGAGALASMLKVNKALTTLKLFDNQIGDAGAGLLSEALKVNKTLATLDLRENGIGHEGAASLASMLKRNTSLTSLHLFANEIGPAGASSLAEALKMNKTLTELDGVSTPEIDTILKDPKRKEERVRMKELHETRQREREERRYEETVFFDPEFRTLETVVKRYGLLVNLRASVEQLRASTWPREHASGEEEEILVYFQHEIACQELSEMSQFLAQSEKIQKCKHRLQELQARVVEEKITRQERDNQRVALVNSLAITLEKPWRNLVTRLEQDKLASWKNKIQLIAGQEHMDDCDVVSVEDLLRGLTNALHEVAQWKRRHDPELRKQRSEESFARLREATTREGFDFWNRESLFSVDDQIVETFYAFKDEEKELEVEDPLSDWPAATVAIIDKVRLFVTKQLPRALQEMSETILDLEKDYAFFSTGLEAPQTEQVKHLVANLHDIEDQRDELEFSLKRIQKQRARGNPIDEAEMRSLEAQLEKLDKTRLSRLVGAKRARLMEFTTNHYPELLYDDDFRTSLGLNELPGGDELVGSGLYMDSLTREDFVTESNISQSAGKVVDIVRDKSGHRKVLKTFLLVHDGARRHFVQQCSAFGKLRHANIVRVEAVFTDTKFGYVLMPLYPGGDLEKWLQDHPAGTRDATVCKQIACDVLNGLHTIHSHGHVHCDLKPGNVFLTQTNRAVIGDFDGVKMENRTVTSNLQVTMRYMAPELTRGDARSVSTSVDMYSFGLILEDLFPDVDGQSRALIDSLLSEDPRLRLSAYDALTHDFFSAKPEPVRDCSMCFDKVRESASVSCCGGHACCETCLFGWLKGGVPKPRVSPSADVMCFDPGCGEIFSSAHLFALKNNNISSILLEQVKELEQVKLQQEYQVRLQLEMDKTVDDLIVKRHRNHILNEILTLACPTCKKAFIDFDSCFAITCEDGEGNGCGTMFCAWCLRNCGTDSYVAHHHVATCARNRSRQDDALFGDHNLRELEMKRLRAERLNQYWAETVSRETKSIQHQLKEILRNFHDRIDQTMLRL